jgi:hypothetical protein
MQAVSYFDTVWVFISGRETGNWHCYSAEVKKAWIYAAFLLFVQLNYEQKNISLIPGK